MLRDFIEFLEKHLDGSGITGLIRAAVGILTFGSVLSVVLGSTAIKASLVVATCLCLLGLLALSTARNRALRAQVDHDRHLLALRCDDLTGQIGPEWHIHHWHESLTVARNGDAIVSITVRATVTSEELRFLRLRLGSGWQQSEHVRRRVRVTTTGVEVDRPGSTQWHDTTYWRVDGRLEILAHCVSSPPRKGDEVRLHMEIVWPGKAAPLMRCAPDEFTVCFSRPLAHLTYRLALPAGTRLKHQPINLREDVDNYALSVFAPRKGRSIVELTAHDIPADRRVGMRLELA
ncbi:hypothetical protein JOF41_000805 [Saccharothrix coeruleofusca]|uniref:hypothetical protein n=1 Tax=Saccharothrix coeruleofusca TaxID=33919 RepID=UPI001AE986D2|nr:hypothetical protein [Saccharothrix coeruleofusca]MBP2334627.1 hypothetical protein [Saccharothrix coeruleofusca]